MDERNNHFDFNFTSRRQSIKKNERQHPSIELFIQLITMFGVG